MLKITCVSMIGRYAEKLENCIFHAVSQTTKSTNRSFDIILYNGSDRSRVRLCYGV
jgi:hypothetical protein